MITELIFTFVYAILFSAIIWLHPFFKLADVKKIWVLSFFLLKIIAGLFLFWVYSSYYTQRETADIFKYFDDSKIMYDALWRKPADYFQMLFGINNDNPYFDTKYYMQMNNWYRVYESNLYNDSHTIIRFNALVRLFSFGYYNVHAVFMSFIAFIGLMGIYKTVQSFFINVNKFLLFAVFLLPSVVFWTSGVLKEGLLVFAMGVFLYLFFKLIAQKKLSLFCYGLMMFTFLLLFIIKLYIIAALVPVLIAYTWVALTKNKKVLFKYFSIIVVLLITALIFTLFSEKFPLLHMLAQKQNDFVNLSISIEAGSLVSTDYLQPTWQSFLYQTPMALVNTLFRPVLWEAGSVMMLPAALENLVVVAFMLLTGFFFKKPSKANLNLFLFSITFTILVYWIIGITTPVLGAIVRYKVPVFPFLIIALLLLWDEEKVKKYLPKFLH